MRWLLTKGKNIPCCVNNKEYFYKIWARCFDSRARADNQQREVGAVFLKRHCGADISQVTWGWRVWRQHLGGWPVVHSPWSLATLALARVWCLLEMRAAKHVSIPSSSLLLRFLTVTLKLNHTSLIKVMVTLFFYPILVSISVGQLLRCINMRYMFSWVTSQHQMWFDKDGAILCNRKTFESRFFVKRHL